MDENQNPMGNPAPQQPAEPVTPPAPAPEPQAPVAEPVAPMGEMPGQTGATAPQAEEKCTTCGGQSANGNCVPCGQPMATCTCPTQV